VSRFDISERDAKFHNLRCAINAGRTMTDRSIRPGTYTGLYSLPRRGPDDGGPVMSDTPAEMADHAYFVKRAAGRVLLTGLGLGLCIHNLLLKKTVTHITVVEKDPELCEWVGPHYAQDSRVNVVCADAFEWKPTNGERFDFGWHDIWPTICGDHVPQIKALLRRFQRACAHQDAWCYYDHLRAAR
jgi:hypothetical protein